MAGYYNPYPGLEDPTHGMGAWGLNAPSITSGDVIYAAGVPPALRGAYGLYSAVKSLMNARSRTRAARRQEDRTRKQLDKLGYDPKKVIAAENKVVDILSRQLKSGRKIVDFDEDAYRAWREDPYIDPEWEFDIGEIVRGLTEEDDVTGPYGFTDDELMGLLEENLDTLRRPKGKPDLRIVRDDEPEGGK